MKSRKSTASRSESPKDPVVSVENLESASPLPEAPSSPPSPIPSESPAAPPDLAAAAPAPPPVPERPAEVITVRLTASACQKLAKHLDGSRWTRETIVDRLIFEHLHGAYPAISYRNVVLAAEGVYRMLDRRIQAPDMVLESGSGQFLIRTRTENPDYEKWLRVHQKQGDPDADRKAREMAVFILQQRLERFDGPGSATIIYPDDFLVERLA